MFLRVCNVLCVCIIPEQHGGVSNPPDLLFRLLLLSSNLENSLFLCGVTSPLEWYRHANNYKVSPCRCWSFVIIAAKRHRMTQENQHSGKTVGLKTLKKL